MFGPKGEISVQRIMQGDKKYRCTYTPQAAGTYLLHIKWSDKQVGDSPYKVLVIPGAPTTEASKVVISTEGLQLGMMGQEISTTIDTRRAGTGRMYYIVSQLSAF